MRASTWADEERALLAALDANTRDILARWRERDRPSRAAWRRALRTERLGRYTPPGYVEARAEPTPPVRRFIRDMVQGTGPSVLLMKAGRPDGRGG